VQGYAYHVSSLESGGYDLAFPVSDPARSIIAAVALEGLLISLENARGQIDQARDIVSALQAIVAREAGALAPHYEHVNPDEIDLG
jgi:DNA-binding IclR family transcriptional regulator